MTLNITNGVKTRYNSTSCKVLPQGLQSSSQSYYFSGIFCGKTYKLTHSYVIAFDLDGTLAEVMPSYDPRRIGKPIPKMIKLVKSYLAENIPVVIFTARLNSKQHSKAQIMFTLKLIKMWTKKYIGQSLPATAEKHHSMKVIYDDRAVQVIHNTGKIVR